MEVDRKTFIADLGGEAKVASMNSEAKANALEEFLIEHLNETAGGTAGKYPTMAEVEAQIETRRLRRGVGNLFLSHSGNVKRLPPMPAQPTLTDFFKLRFKVTSNHVLQSANLAMKNGMSEEIVLACLLHDTAQELIKVDHGWWSAQLWRSIASPDRPL